MNNECVHINSIQDVTPSADGCEECLKNGDTWVHLRLCLNCGHVGCCDESKNKHATKHFLKNTTRLYNLLNQAKAGNIVILMIYLLNNL